MNLHSILAEVERDVGEVQEVIGEVLLDHVAPISQADNEIVDSVRRIDLHNVPEDGLAPHLHHGLRSRLRLFGQTRSLTTCQNDCLHEIPSEKDERLAAMNLDSILL